MKFYGLPKTALFKKAKALLRGAINYNQSFYQLICTSIQIIVLFDLFLGKFWCWVHIACNKSFHQRHTFAFDDFADDPGFVFLRLNEFQHGVCLIRRDDAYHANPHVEDLI